MKPLVPPLAKQTSDAWNGNAEIWTQRLRSGGDVSRDYMVIPAMLSSLNLPRCSVVLEVGAGECSFSAALMKEFGCVVIASDYSFRMCQLGKELVGSSLSVVAANASALPFRAACFDAVVANMVFHSIGNLDAALAGVSNVLHTGGVLLFSILNPARVIPNEDLDSLRSSVDSESVVSVVDYTRRRTVQASLKIGGPGFLPRKVQYEHRLLSDYARSLHEAGFVTEELIEPLADVRALGLHPNMANFWALAPFLVWKAVKRTE